MQIPTVLHMPAQDPSDKTTLIVLEVNTSKPVKRDHLLTPLSVVLCLIKQFSSYICTLTVAYTKHSRLPNTCTCIIPVAPEVLFVLWGFYRKRATWLHETHYHFIGVNLIFHSCKISNTFSLNKKHHLKVKIEIPRTASAFSACGNIKAISEMHLQSENEQLGNFCV